jgi:O-antigen/teichoic acid export membrane protein
MDRQPRLRERAVSSAFWASAQSWGQQVVQLVVFVTLARLLGPEAYGLVGVALTVTTIGILVINRGGWTEALIQEPDLGPDYLDTVFWWLVALSLALFGGAWIAAGPVAAWFGTPEVERILPWLALIVPFKALGIVQDGLLRRQLQYRALAVRSLTGVVLGGIAGIAAALLGAGAWSLVINQVGQLGVESLVLWMSVRWRPGGRLSLARLCRVVGYAWGVLGASALEVGEDLVARTLVARLIGVVAVGHYTIARRLLLLSEQLLVGPLSGIAMPLFSQIGHRRGELEAPLRLGLQITALVTFPAYVGLALVMPDLLPLVFGRQWSSATRAVQIAVLLGPALPIARLCAALLLALRHATALAALNTCATAALFLLLCAFPKLTVEAVMAGFVLRTWLILPLTVAVVHRLTRVDVLGCLRTLLPLLLATLLMAFAVAGVRWGLGSEAPVLWRLGLSALAGAAVYGLVVAVAARPLLGRGWQIIRARRRSSALPSGAA